MDLQTRAVQTLCACMYRIMGTNWHKMIVDVFISLATTYCCLLTVQFTFDIDDALACS